MLRLVLHLTALYRSSYSKYLLHIHPRYRLLLSNLESLCLPHGWLDLFLHMAFHKSHRLLYPYRLLFLHYTCSSLHHSNHRYAFLLLLCGLRLLLHSHSHIYGHGQHRYALLPLLHIHHSYGRDCHPYVLMLRFLLAPLSALSLLHLKRGIHSFCIPNKFHNHLRYKLPLSHCDSQYLLHGWLDLLLRMIGHKLRRSLYLYRLLLHHCN